MSNIANPAFIFDMRRSIFAALDDEEISPRTLSRMLTRLSEAIRLPKRGLLPLPLMPLPLVPREEPPKRLKPRFDDRVSPCTGVWLDEPGQHYAPLPPDTPPLTREGYAIQTLQEALKKNGCHANLFLENSKENLKRLLIEALEENEEEDSS